MVYYTALPLLVKTETSSEEQLCSNSSNDVHSAINYQNDQQLVNLTSSNMEQQNYSNYQQHQVMHKEPIQQQQLQQQQPTKPQFKCDQCNMLFGSKSAHTSHIKSHAKQQNYQQQPQPQQSVPTNLSVGAPILNSSEPYQCDVCKKTFAVPARLVRHYRTHTGERPFACEFCLKTFSVKENLQVHRRIHTKERPYKCDVCERAFEHSGKLHRHMRIHTGERPHKCSVCGKTFIQSGQLVIHMRTHTGEKPYKCPVEGCGKGFTCSKQLKVHSRTHTGEKPYHCDICFRDFGYNHVLKLHRVQHYGSKCYKCTICDETFKSKKEMEAHIKGHANDIPDEDEERAQSVDMTPINQGRPDEVTINTIPQQITSNINQMPETPKGSSSEANSDGDDLTYYNMYSRFEQSVVNNYGVQSGVNPALLAAASIAAAANFEEQQRQMISPPPSSSNSITSNGISSSPINLQTLSNHSMQSTSPSYMYEPLVVMRQDGYFAPAPPIEFR